jgi:hypothetical protein
VGGDGMKRGWNRGLHFLILVWTGFDSWTRARRRQTPVRGTIPSRCSVRRSTSDCSERRAAGGALLERRGWVGRGEVCANDVEEGRRVR